MAQPLAALGSTQECLVAESISPNGETRARTQEASVSIQTSDGPGRTTCASFITVLRVIDTANHIPAQSQSSGGTSRQNAGRDTTFPMFRCQPMDRDTPQAK